MDRTVENGEQKQLEWLISDINLSKNISEN